MEGKPPADSGRIFFGSLEKQAQKLSEKQPEDEEIEEADAATLPFSAETEASHERYTQLLEQIEQKKKAKAIPVSTNDEVVKSKLRELGEPIILFGEQVNPQPEVCLQCLMPSS